MRIALSLLAFRPGRIGGAETYLRRLLEHLPAHAGNDDLLAVMDRNVAEATATPGFRRLVVPRGAGAVAAERILEAFTSYRADRIARLLEAHADVVLHPQQSIFPIGAAVPPVMTVHDLQHLALPEHFGLFDRHFRARAYPPSLERASRIVAVSEVTRRDLAGRCGVDPARVDVVPHGLDPVANPPATPYQPGAPYLYYPSASHPHKGHDVLLRTFAALRNRGYSRHLLVLSGQRTAYWDRLRRLVRQLGLAEAVRHLGFLPSQEVDRVYAGAEAVLFPTQFEGFGIPVLEAVARGKRIVVTRLPIFDELGVPARWQIDFADPAQLAAALTQDGPTRLTRRPWTWDEVARRTMEILRAAAE